MNTIQRIKKYIDYKSISVKKFEETVGFSNGAFASQLKNNKTIGVDKLENILKCYPDINPTWLLTGEGDMLLDEAGIRIHRYAQKAKDEADLTSKALTWLLFSVYEKQTGCSFSFDSFQRFAEIFNLASTYAEVMQKSLETELLVDLANNIKDYPMSDDGSILIPESLTEGIDKYVEIYKTLESICTEIWKIIEVPSAQKKIIKYAKNKSS